MENDIAMALREVAQALQGNEGSFFTSVPFWAAIISVATFFIGHQFSRSKFKHEITLRCIDRYQEIVKRGVIAEYNLATYLGFMNEELYYIQKGYIPKAISQEWLANMMNTVPVFLGSNHKTPINEGHLKRSSSILQTEESWNLLFPYSRLRSILFINGCIIDYKYVFADNIFDAQNNIERNNMIKKKIVKEMLRNLRKSNII